MRSSIFVAVACIASTRAHIALWDKAMFGMNYPDQIGDAQNYNNAYPVHPLREADGLSKDQWFAHGYKGFPPKDGDFMVLPAGGTYDGEQACNRAETKYRNPNQNDAFSKFACRGGEGAIHSTNLYNGTVDPKAFGGTALAIAYTSDVASLEPNDMTIISIVQQSVWTREISYSIPAGLPECPPGGCLCTWNWIHRGGNGEGYPFEIYNLLYRCTVTGGSTTNVVQRGQVPKDCTWNPSACVQGAKTPMYLYQASGNNLPHLDVPPMYNSAWGFNEGAQNDIFTTVNGSTPAPTTYQNNPYASVTTTGTDSASMPTATSLSPGWQTLGCFIDQDPRALNGPQIYSGNDVTISMGVSLCDKAGYKYAMIENGNEIWCGSTAKLVSAPPSECNVRCKGDPYAFCGGGWRGNAYVRVDYEATNTGLGNVTATSANSVAAPTGSPTPTSTTPAGPSSIPTENLPSGWEWKGCSVDQDYPRALDQGSDQFPTNNTNPGCALHCASKGFKFAGTQYGAECWCGQTSRFVAGTGCDKPCAGDTTKFCGGSYRISIMEFTGTAGSNTTSVAGPTATPTTVSSTSTLPSSSSSSTSVSETASNSTSSVATSSSSSTSVTTSSSSSILPSSSVAMNSTSSSISSSSSVTSSTTSSSTSSAAQTTSSSSSSSSKATSTSTISSSTSSSAQSSSSSSTPVASSSSSKAVSSSSTATSTSSSSSKATSSSSSSTSSSSAAATSTFGGISPPQAASNSATTAASSFAGIKPPSASTATTTTTSKAPAATIANILPGNWRSLGCFVDGYNRVLPNYFYKPRDNSPKYCINLCSSLGFKYAGVEARTDCGCGNSLAGLTRRLTTCTASCPADSKSTCGGTWAIEVFSNTTQSIPRRDIEERGSGVGRRVRSSIIQV